MTEDRTPESTHAVTLDRVTKRYGTVTANNELSLDIRRGEFFSFLGPSGCGKTTLLRIIGGFIAPDEGEVRIEGKDVSRVPPNRRPSNLVFQDYALFPHLDVARNVGFGLVERGESRRAIRERVSDALAMVHLEGYEKRKTEQLSGGERQRVALARALVLEPVVLLLDEPLGALDARLRRAMQLELKRIQRDVRITFVYVTHDQEEAMTMSDRIAVMNAGQFEHVGTPEEIYERPQSLFVAGFIGEANLMTVTIADAGSGRASVTLEGGERMAVAPDEEVGPVGASRTLLIRPEHVRVTDEPPASGDAMEGVLVEQIYQGANIRYEVELASGGTVVSFTPKGERCRATAGERVWVRWDADACSLLEGAGAAGLPSPDGAVEAAAT